MRSATERVDTSVSELAAEELSPTTYEWDDAKKATLDYFEGDELAATVWLTKYAMTDKEGRLLERTPEDMHHRLAREFARIEARYPNPMSAEEIFGLLDRFEQVVPQGSPMAGIGNPYLHQSLSNCYTLPTPYDSYAGITHTDQQLVQVLKRRGGAGLDISSIRPKGLPTSNAARTTDGIGVFMQRFSRSTREVAQGGRRGALLMSISVAHPDIETFIDIKRDKKKVTGANISIRISDEFMNAVVNDGDFDLRWPVDSSSPVVLKKVRAKALWDRIIDAAWDSAEPGVFFWDNMIKNSPADIYTDEGFGTTSTNPCGEIGLSPMDSCRLLLLNLLGMVKNAFQSNAELDWELLERSAYKAQRLMDDLVDLELEKVDDILRKVESDPEPPFVKVTELALWQGIKRAAVKGRRTGLGLTAMGDCLAALGVRYGSPESIELVERIYRTLCLGAYRSSVDLAEERGAFEVCDPRREEHHPYLSRIMALDPDLKEKWLKVGRRNIALLTTSPAGSVSTLTRTTSGIEPAFQLWYTRRKKITGQDVDARVDFTDASGDQWTEFKVYHHGFRKWIETACPFPVDGTLEGIDLEEASRQSPYFQATANDVDWHASVDLQAAAQKWVCHSISKTCNLPRDVSRETVAEVYMRAWAAGCKGFTVYRDGSRDGVLLTNKSTSAIEAAFQPRQAPKRPDELPVDIHHTAINNESWTVMVGLLDGHPYEVFGGLTSMVCLPKRYTTGRLIRHPRKHKHVYELRCGEGDDELVVRNIVAAFDNPNHAAFTRVISLSLRHGASAQYVVEQLLKDADKDMNLFSFNKSIARVLKKYIEDGAAPTGSKDCHECGAEDSLRYQEGCVSCSSCGYSKCA